MSIEKAISSNDVPTLVNWVGCKATEAGNRLSTLEVSSPHTNEIIAYVPISGYEEVDSAVKSSEKAFLSWSGLTYKTRAQYLLKLYNALTEHMDELADLIVKEHGKNKTEAIGEVQKGLETLEYAISLPQLVQGKVEDVSRGVQCRDERVALGVVASIVPFNFPFMVPFWTLPIAIGCGNTMVLKPSEKVPITMTRVAEISQSILPEGVLNIVHGDKSTVESLISHKGISAVTFVGTSAVAELISHTCTRLNKRVLALGGAKNHLVALPDCDIEMTAQDIVNSFTGCAGERCMAASALLIVENAKKDGAEGSSEKFSDRLIKRVVDIASKINPGSDQSPRVMGPIIDKGSLIRIENCISQAESEGAKILLDGRLQSEFVSKRKDTNGNWLGPTVILHGSTSDSAMHTEIFGPVISVYICESAQEAIEIENANDYGNAACIYTGSGAAAEWFTKRFRAGMLGVNIGVPVPREPFSFGGIQRSKFGVTDITGDGGIEFFTYRRKITTKWSVPVERSWMD
ncbi:hypothetical protein H4219_000650 [Mycoemilia scoparia]|uniref:Aldehyde dehydrogenase domain-containing protein n=1 Tax=Mycoemilia scoparia TaxID=417184 RepID=A0A9W8ABB1_9FUNG|nr:hypothetical protein H4219_000650 [Mycoemilia scoparia]